MTCSYNGHCPACGKVRQAFGGGCECWRTNYAPQHQFTTEDLNRIAEAHKEPSQAAKDLLRDILEMHAKAIFNRQWDDDYAAMQSHVQSALDAARREALYEALAVVERQFGKHEIDLRRQLRALAEKAGK